MHPLFSLPWTTALLVMNLGLPVYSAELNQKDSLKNRYNALNEKRFAEGDALFFKRRDQSIAKQALEKYREYAQAYPKDAEASWRLSMGCYYYGNRFLKETEARIQLHQEGIDAGQKAIKLNPRCAACHFWTAINIALWGDAKGIFSTISKLTEIEKHLEASIEIDPNYAYGGALRLLGVIHWKVPWILGGSDSTAKKYFEKAIRTAPEEPLQYMFLSQILLAEFDDLPGAIDAAKRGIAVPPPTAGRVEAVDAIRDLKTFLEKKKWDWKTD